MEAARENLNTWLAFDDKLFMVVGFLVDTGGDAEWRWVKQNRF